MPASSTSSASRSADSGVSSAGFSTTVLPHASAGPSFQLAMLSGKFQGTIRPTTPSGSRNVNAYAAGDGDRLRRRACRPRPRSSGRPARPCRPRRGRRRSASRRCALSIRASSSACSSTSVASRRSSRARSAGATRRQAGPAAFARATAASVSSDAGLLELGDRLLGGGVEDAERHGRLLNARSSRRLAAGAAEHPRLGDERLEQPRVLALLGVPEHAEGEALRRVLDRLDRAVLGPCRPREARPPAGRSPGGGATSPARARRRGRPRAGCPPRRVTPCSANVPGVGWCSSCPTTSGRCWTRSPPRATLRICEPRQTASTGRSRSSAAGQQRELGVVPLRRRRASSRDARPRRTRRGRGRRRRRRRARRARRASPPPRRRRAGRAAAARLRARPRVTYDSGTSAEGAVQCAPGHLGSEYVVIPISGRTSRSCPLEQPLPLVAGDDLVEEPLLGAARS